MCRIGSGPIGIGQACEFDYAGSQALKVLRAEGFRTIVVNSNPATIMTDPGFADRTYLEPLDVAGLADVLPRERPAAPRPHHSRAPRRARPRRSPGPRPPRRAPADPRRPDGAHPRREPRRRGR